MARQIRCADTGMDCEFEVRGDDELVRVLRQHAREPHDATVSRSDARKLVQSV